MRAVWSIAPGAAGGVGEKSAAEAVVSVRTSMVPRYGKTDLEACQP